MDKMHNLDLKLKLLSGAPFEVEGAGLAHPFTLRDISDIGYGKYSQLLYLFTLNVKDFAPNAEIEGINAFDLIANSENQSLIDILVNGVKKIFRVEQAKFSLHYQCVFIGDYAPNVLESNMLTSKNFLQLQDMMMHTNCLDMNKPKEYDPKDDKAQEIIRKMKKANEKIQKAKGDSGDSQLDIADIISAVAAKSFTISLTNAWDLTLYQLYDAYKRLDAVESYHVAIQSLLHGASSDKVELKHWSSKLE